MTAVASQHQETEIPVFAYTDESNNTGLDIFNRDQPTFYTLTALARSDLNATVTQPLKDWCDKLCVARLHANEVKLPGLSIIAPSMLEFIMDVKPLFLATVVEKRHVGRLKFVDAVLDSGLNKAVSGMHYAARPMRLMMARSITKYMLPRIERDFWEAFRRADVKAFRDVVQRVESRVAIFEEDSRGRELLLDALRWAARYPEELLVKRGNLDSPNLVAFGFVVQGIHDILHKTNLRVRTFIHDEQNQFMGAFRKTYDHVRQIRFGEQDFFPDFELAQTFDCPLTEAKSKDTPALQFVDAMLWLLKRFLEGGTTGSDECDELLAPVLALGHVNEFSAAQLEQSLVEEAQRLWAVPLSDKRIKAGLKLRDQMEQMRKARMLEAGE